MTAQIAPAADPTSWIILILFSLFLTACFRVRGNLKFVGSFFSDLVMVRERDNLFDTTVRETSLIFLMLLLSGCSFGVLLQQGVELFGSRLAVRADIPDITLPDFIAGAELPSALICMALCCAYIGVMWLAYYLVGIVFSDGFHTWLWVRGFTAATALASVVMFPLALVSLIYPQWHSYTVAVALVMLILVKIVFIIKGFRIFFTESSSWVVFLYYLCSLEIIPLVLTFGLACSLLG
ncbi:MAG: DUF4271 domain-containing protein [Muribaculaceae bacterium]|nr:DUF4271 domain-containing protein [Muribaculaceae bacterium]